jgi:hypothetical protein
MGILESRWEVGNKFGRSGKINLYIKDQTLVNVNFFTLRQLTDSWTSNQAAFLGSRPYVGHTADTLTY